MSLPFLPPDMAFQCELCDTEAVNGCQLCLSMVCLDHLGHCPSCKLCMCYTCWQLHDERVCFPAPAQAGTVTGNAEEAVDPETAVAVFGLPKTCTNAVVEFVLDNADMADPCFFLRQVLLNALRVTTGRVFGNAF